MKFSVILFKIYHMMIYQGSLLTTQKLMPWWMTMLLRFPTTVSTSRSSLMVKVSIMS